MTDRVTFGELKVGAKFRFIRDYNRKVGTIWNTDRVFRKTADDEVSSGQFDYRQPDPTEPVEPITEETP